MNALLLAAGFGTRLGEFGQTIPKGLIVSRNTTLIERVIRDVQGIPDLVSKRAVVSNERFAKLYSQWLQEHGYTDSFRFLSDGTTEPEKRKGALGDILFCLEELSWWDEDLLVLSTDTYYEFSMKEFAQFAKEKGSFATVVRDMGTIEQIRNRLGCAVLEGDRIASFVEKPANPPSTYAAIPFYYYSKQALQALRSYAVSGGNLDAPGNIIPWFIQQEIPVFAFKTEGTTIDVGTLADVETLRGV